MQRVGHVDPHAAVEVVAFAGRVAYIGYAKAPYLGIALTPDTIEIVP